MHANPEPINAKPKKSCKIKKNIEEYFKFFEDNIKTYKKSMRFAFKETLDQRDRDVLKYTKKPPLQINYVQAYLSRLLGEASKISPDVTVSGNGTGSDVNVNTVKLVEGHMRSILDRFHKTGCSDQVFKELCGGGFSVLKVSTEYRNNETFEQDIVLGKAGDPVMCFFDPMAKLPSKSDGKICGEIIPMTKKDAKKKYPKFADIIDEMAFNTKSSDGNSAPFSWSYKNGTKNIVLVADTFIVEYKKRVRVQLSDDKTMLESEYNRMIKEWDSIEPPPSVVKRRETKDKKIKRYVMLGEHVIEEEKTSLPGLPYIFVDGMSAPVYRNDIDGEIEQVTHSYIHNAMDAQKLLNYTCQTIANFSENLMQQKYIIDERGIVEESQWTNPQEASVLIKRSIDEEGRDVPPPENVHQEDLPASIMGTFQSMQQIMQNTLGSYDAQLGINESQLSGIAIQEGATQNNAVAMPFMNGMLNGLNAALDGLIIKMMPLYYVTPMTIPYTDDEGEKHFIKINQRLADGSDDPNSMRMDYKGNDLDVNVASGYSFAIQKDKSLKAMEGLSKAFPAFGELVNRKGLPIIIDNLDIRGADKLKQMANEAQKEAENQPNQPNPVEQQMMMKQQEMAANQREFEVNTQLKNRELDIEERKIASNEKIAELKFQQGLINDAVQHEKVGAEISTHQSDNAAKLADHLLRKEAQEHTHTLDVMKAHK